MNFCHDHIRLKQTCLVSALALVYAQSSFALQEMSEDSMSESTGAGIALVLDDFKMVFQGPNDVSTTSAYDQLKIPFKPGPNASPSELSTYNEALLNYKNASQNDTGFIRIIPTGENYNQLGQRAYNKIYSDNYNQAVLEGKAEYNYNAIYKNTYDTAYETNFDSLLESYTKDIPTNVEKRRDTFERDVFNEFYNSAEMRRYYQQRYDDYQRNSGLASGPENDGTQEEYLVWNPLKLEAINAQARDFAESNTREMVELLYGSRSGESIPTSTFLQSLGSNFVRSNQISSKATDLITAAILEEERLATLRAENNADLKAEEEAKKATEALYKLIVNEAVQAAQAAAINSSARSLRTKADVFIYGLALSKSDGSLSTRYSNQGFNWGTASNPWLFRAGTENVRQFRDKAENLGYLALEAPLANTALEDPANIENTSFNIKLGFWSDIFSRELNSSREVNPITGAPISGLDKEYRLRTQFIANGLSLNGSQVRMFQTLESDNKNYNQTFGMASLLRLNTNDNPADLSIRQTDLDRKGIRIGTATLDDLDSEVATPAMKRGSLAPIFHDTEGLYLYSPNINLVLGNMYQPFIVGSEGNNIILEVTRIPKVASIYNQIYQNYGDGLGTSDLKGSTCNVNSCGTAIDIKGTSYQGRNATHSSIAIGTTERLSNNMLRAKDGADATGVVFKGVDGSIKNLGSVAIDGVLIQHLKIRTTGL